MTRKTATVMLEEAGCVAGSTQTVERVLRDVPGVLRVYANPVTEAAYVEYDAERCSEGDLVRALESLDLRAVLAPGRRTNGATPPLQERLSMRSADRGSRTWLALAGFGLIAAFFLFTEHRAHLFGWLPFLFLLSCPLLHMLGHGGHGDHGSQQKVGSGSGPAGLTNVDHRHSSGATRDTSRSEP